MTTNLWEKRCVTKCNDAALSFAEPPNARLFGKLHRNGLVAQAFNRHVGELMLLPDMRAGCHGKTYGPESSGSLFATQQ